MTHFPKIWDLESRVVSLIEGNPLDLAKAKTLCDAIVRVQEMNGGQIVPTHWRVRDLTGGKCKANWTNCTVLTADGLEYVATVAERETKK